MTRIFLTLSIAGTALLLVAFGLGWWIGDATQASENTRVTWHLLTGLGALCFGTLVHALALTYMMGTGRWLEETCAAYRLPSHWQQGNRDIKLRLYPALCGGMLLLIITGAFGAAADPASAVGFRGFGGFSAAHIHLAVASATLLINLGANVVEWQALRANGRLVAGVLQEVRRMRMERGLPV